MVRSLNSAPVCDAAASSLSGLWPPDHRYTAIGINGVTDPDGDTVAITIDSIFQDEPVDGIGDGATVPDGQGVGNLNG